MIKLEKINTYYQITTKDIGYQSKISINFNKKLHMCKYPMLKVWMDSFIRLTLNLALS